MIDLKLLQNDFETYVSKLQKKRVDPEMISTLKEMTLETKTLRQHLETLQTLQNEKSRLFGQYKKEGKDTTELKEEVDANKIAIATAQEKVNIAQEALDEIALRVPNFPDDSVPVGNDENDNVIIKHVLEPRKFDFEPKDHAELGENLGWIDFERGVKLSKSRFSVLSSGGATLERKLINFMLDFNIKRGFEEASLPYIVNRPTMTGTGQLPKFEDDLFKIEGEDLFLIPTAEVPLTNLFYDEILTEDVLPIKLTAHTPCFRKEAGSAGRDTRGIIRQHQFHKVELVSITTPEQSDAMLEEMVACASGMLEALGLPHRLVTLCGGDMGFSAAKTVDIEVWIPSQNCYREISSISTCGDFQARRAKIRYKNGTKNSFVHTLNGSSLAVGRTIVALMENYQNSDGTISLPPILEG